MSLLYTYDELNKKAKKIALKEYRACDAVYHQRMEFCSLAKKQIVSFFNSLSTVMSVDVDYSKTDGSFHVTPIAVNKNFDDLPFATMEKEPFDLSDLILMWYDYFNKIRIVAYGENTDRYETCLELLEEASVELSKAAAIYGTIAANACFDSKEGLEMVIREAKARFDEEGHLVLYAL